MSKFTPGSLLVRSKHDSNFILFVLVAGPMRRSDFAAHQRLTFVSCSGLSTHYEVTVSNYDTVPWEPSPQ